MRYALTIVVAIGAVSAAAIAVAPSIVPTQAAKSEIARRIGAWSGGPVAVGGEPEVTVFPAPGIVVRNVTVPGAPGASDRPFVTIPKLEASLRILPLLMGRIEVGSLTLVDSHINLIRNRAGTPNWSVGRVRSRDTLGAMFSRDIGARPGEIILRDSTIYYEDWHSGRHETVTATDIRIGWLRGMQDLTLAGTFEWRGDVIELTAELDEPLAAFSGPGSTGRMTLAAQPTELPEADDDASPARERYVGGGPPDDALPEGLAGQLGVPIGPLDIAGTVEVHEGVTTLSEATIELDGNVAEGAVSLDLDGDRPALTGSLVFDEVDLGPYIDEYIPKSLAEFLALPVSPRWITYADVDLGITADEIDFGAVASSDAAVRLVTRQGRMVLELRRAHLAGGRLAATASMEPAGDGAAIRVAGRARDVSLSGVGDILWAVSSSPLIGTDKPPQGIAEVMVDLQAEGDTVRAILASLDGRGVARIRDGSVDGADIVSTLERLVDGNEIIGKGHAPFVPVAGRTHFTQMTARMAVGDGVARADRIRLSGERFEITLSGEGDLERGELLAEGTASLYAPVSRDARRDLNPVVELPFGIGGTVQEPVVAPGIPRIGHAADKAGIRLSHGWVPSRGGR